MPWPRQGFFWKVLLGFAVIVVALAIVISNVLRGFGPNIATLSPLRTIKTAEFTYAATYPHIGYAPNLAILGGMKDCGPKHACLLDNVLACPEGVGTAWCVKGMYRYNVQSSSRKAPYRDFWVTAAPITVEPNLRDYCAGPDSVIRSEPAKARTAPYTLAECLTLSAVPSNHYRRN
jgi:hypothetical protein